MRRTLSIALLAGTVMMAAPGLVPAAQAGGGFFFGGGFRIGGFPFVIAYAEPGYSHHHGYYYRTPRHFAYRGHSCSSACYRDAGYYYHHESCPVAHRYFQAYDVDYRWVLSTYAPYYDRYGHHGDYGHYGNYGNYGRYDHYDRYDDRYDRQDRYDRYDGRHSDDRYDRAPRRRHHNDGDYNRQGRGHRRHDQRSHRGRQRPHDH